MSKNGNYPNIAIKPIEMFSRPLVSHNFMNSPKSNPVKLFKQDHSLYQTRSSGEKCQDPTSRINNQQKYGLRKAHQPHQISDREGKVMGNFNPSFSGNNRDNQPMAEENFQNLAPNNLQYQQMHNKLNALQNKLTTMRQKFIKKKEQRKKNSGEQEKKNTSMNSKSKSKDRDRDSGRRQSKQKNKKIDKNDKNTDALKHLVSQVNCKKNIKILNSDPYLVKNHIYYVSEIIRAYKEQNSLARDHLINSHRQLKALQKIRGFNQQILDQNQLKLNKKHIHQGKKTILFDLDQTLIHCNQNVNAPCDIKLKIKFPTGQLIEAGINIRPHATQILKNLSKKFQIIVFTASHSTYANQVLNYLDPQNQYISHRLFREHCYQTPEGVFIKDLRVINRQLSQTVLIDNAAYSYCLQIQNGIPIIPYYQGKVDFELKALEKYLQGLASCRDVRDINRNVFKLNKYVQFDHPDVLVQTLYGQISQ